MSRFYIADMIFSFTFSAEYLQDFHGIRIKSNGEYSTVHNEDRNDYCMGWKSPPCDPLEAVDNFTSDAWKFVDSIEILGVPVWGELHTYSGGGYIANLDINRDMSKIILQELWRAKWLDDQTRGVLLEYTLFNQNQNLFCVVTLLLEYLETGGVFPFPKIHTFRVYLHEGIAGLWVLICEGLFILFVLYLILKHIYLIYKHGLKNHFTVGWNVLDLFIIVASGVTIAMYVGRWQLSKQLLTKFHKDPTLFVNFQMVALFDESFNAVMACVVFLATVKLMGIFAFSADIGAFLSVLQVGKNDLLSYGVIFLALFLAFGALGYLLFGTVSVFYSTILRSLMELLGTMLGKIHPDAALMLEPIYTRLYFTLYTITSITILVNTLVIILCDSIDQVNVHPFTTSFKTIMQ